MSSAKYECSILFSSYEIDDLGWVDDRSTRFIRGFTPKSFFNAKSMLRKNNSLISVSLFIYTRFLRVTNRFHIYNYNFIKLLNTKL